jgi:F0F1-type ATP synthase assembly protein I
MAINSNNRDQNKKFRNISLTFLGWELALPIFGGVFIGYEIDQALINSKHLFTVSLLIIGILVGYYNLYKLIDLEMLRIKVNKSNLEDQGEV